MEHRDEEHAQVEPVTSPDGSAAAKSAKSETWEWIKALLIAAVLVIVIRWLIFAPFIVDGESMEPNFQSKERLIVNKILYKIRKPDRGEVIVFHATADKDYIKRVIALPGETVKVVGDKIFINGVELEQEYLKEAIEAAAQKGRPYNDRNFPETLVPEGKIFVMGDNRSNSTDSRAASVGFVDYDRVVGRADLIFWPLGKISLVHF